MTVENKKIELEKTSKEYSYWGGVWKRLRQNKLAMFSLVVLIIIILACVFVPMFSKYTIAQVISTDANQAPSAKHLLGTDKMGMGQTHSISGLKWIPDPESFLPSTIRKRDNMFCLRFAHRKSELFC